MKRQNLFRFSLFFMTALLLVSLAAVADVPMQADLSASSLQSSGSAQIAGPLVAFFQEQTNRHSGGASPAFTLQAAHLRMELDSAEPSIRGGAIEARPLSSMTPSSYEEATVTGLSNGVNYAFHVFSIDESSPARVEASAGCADATSSGEATLLRAPWADPNHRQVTTRDISQALQWTCIDGASIQITGDFWLSLWVWNATLTADGTTQELHTGPQQSSSLPSGAPDASGAISHDQEIYFYATNATLTVPALTAKAYTLLTGPETQVSGGSFHLTGATGSLAVQGEERLLQRSDVKLTGNAKAFLSGRGANQPFQARLTGSVDGGSLDGHAFAVTVPASPASRSSWPWLLGAVGLVAVSVLVPVRRRAKAARRQRLLELADEGTELLNRGFNQEALDIARKILDLKPDHARGHFLLAVSLGRMHEYPRALAHHRAVAQLLRSTPEERYLRGENALQAALATAAAPQDQTRGEEVLAWLKEALAARKELEDELRCHWQLHPYLGALGLSAPSDASIA